MRRLFSALTALALCLALLPASVMAVGTTHAVSTREQLLAALANAKDGDTIQISGSVVFQESDQSGQENVQESMVIDKAVTITGGTLTLRCKGMVLGADVTFRDISLQFPCRARNAILANGYTLTLENVALDTGGQQIHLFCGGLTGGSQTDLPQTGPHGKVVIKGFTSLGNIYAGSISADGNSNSFDKPASIVIDPGATGKMGTVYACGALETPVKDNWFDVNYQVDPPTPSATGSIAFPVTGPVDIRLSHRVVTSVDGATGGSRNADVSFAGGEFLVGNVTLKNLASLTMTSGSLAPTQGSSFSADAALSVPADTTLDLSQIESPHVGSFSGGGRLVMGQRQTMTVDGAVTGTTAVYVGSVGLNGSGEVPAEGHTYLLAPQSTADSFQLAKYSNRPDLDLQYNAADGSWTAGAVGEAARVIVERLDLGPEIKADSGIEKVEINLVPTFAENSATPSYMDVILLGITMDNNTTRWTQDEDGHYTYTIGYKFTLEACEDILYMRNFSGGAIPDGTYKIGIDIPGSNTASGQVLQYETTLTVGEETPEPPEPPQPTVYSVTVNGSQAGTTGAGSYEPGTEVTVQAGTREGYTFTGWTAQGVTLTDPSSDPVTFSMPENDVTLTAGWKENSSTGGGTGGEGGSTGGGNTGGGSTGGGSLGGGSLGGDSAGSGRDQEKLPVTTDGEGRTVAAPEVHVEEGAAVAELSAQQGGELAKQAAESGSREVVIAPAVDPAVDKTQVILPAAALEELSQETQADLTVSVPAAQVRFPNESLEALGTGEGPVSICVERTGSGVALEVTAGEETLTDIPGGVTLTVPWESRTPGTVAVLVGADGSRQVIRGTAASQDGLIVPLEGSAVLEIVDNARSFADVPADGWMAGPVAFVSSRELFSGTGGDAFEPYLPMTRGMLATVLYRLDGERKGDVTASFADVDQGAWYSNAVSWGAGSGVVKGLENGLFAPEDPVTREQVYTMLHRYARILGLETSGSGAAAFRDSGLISGWAREAMDWAVAAGLAQGRGENTLAPGEPITRAEVAVILERFVTYSAEQLFK